MMKRSYIAILVFTLIGWTGVCVAQDNARLAERTLNGTARYVGMAGAMTAIGGDPSAAMDNPAGLGLYRRSELMITIDYAYDLVAQQGLTADPKKTHIFSAPQASWVVCFPTTNIYEVGTQFHNLMLSYRRLHTYDRAFYAQGGSDASLGALVAATGVNLGMDYCTDRMNRDNLLNIREGGGIDEYAFQWATNISNKWYVGLGINMQSYHMTSEGIYEETFAKFSPIYNKHYYNRNATSLLFSGLSCTFSAGLIYRPLHWLRMGFSLQTASMGYVTTYTNGTFSAQTDSIGISNAPEGVWDDSDIRLPWRTSTSVAFQLSKIGMISLQYDYAHIKGVDDMHSWRAGMEFVPVAGMYINAGYAYESTFNSHIVPVPMVQSFDRQDTYYMRPLGTQYASVAMGFRGKYMIAQAAYQYRWQRIALGAHEDAQPYNMHADTHRIVITLAWHRPNI